MPNGVPAFEAAPYIVSMWEGIGHGEGSETSETGGEGKKTEDRRQRFSCGSGFQPRSCALNDFYEFNDLNGFNDFNDLLLTTILTVSFPTKIVVF